MSSPSPQVQVDAVIFDFGKVLVQYDWTKPLAEASRRMGVPPDGIKRKLFAQDLFFEFERGRLTPREFHANFERALGGQLAFDEFCELWNAIFTGAIEPTVELALKLRAERSVQVAVLSNTNELHAAVMRNRFGWFTGWDHVYFSHEIGQRKPDAAAFEHVLSRLNVPASRAAFVDDMPANVDAAKRLGMHAILADSPEAVASGLANLGVKVY